MHLSIRRAMLWCSFALFIGIAPLIILYAIGYRPVTSTIPQAVGVILVRTLPNKAMIFINDISYGLSPKSIPNLLPGTASVSISKNGYSDWKKTVPVKAIQATDIRQVRLIPTTPDQDILSVDTRMFEIAPNNTSIAIHSKNNTIAVITADGKQSSNAIPIKQLITSISWSPDSKYIALTTQKSDVIIIHVISPVTIEKITTPLPSSLATIMWDSSKNNALMGITTKHELIRYDISTAILESVSSNIQTYGFTEGKLITQHLDSSLVTATSTFDIKKSIKTIVPSSSGRIVLLLTGGDVLLIQQNGTMQTIASHALSVMWSPNELLLLIQTSPEELHVYNVADNGTKDIPIGELHLLTRLSTAITNPLWFTDSAHILYQTDNQLYISEIDPRDHIISYVVSPSAPQGSSVYINPDGKSVLHITSNAVSNSLARTWLVTKEDR